MSLELRPLSNRVVVVTDDPIELSEGGIQIPDTAQEKPQIGTVIAVGPGKVSEFPVVQASAKGDVTEEQLASFGASFKRMPMHIEVGNRILFGKYTGTEVKIDVAEEGEGRKMQEFLVLRETDILCLLKEEEDEQE